MVMSIYVILKLYSFQSHLPQTNDQLLDMDMQQLKKIETQYLSWEVFKVNSFAQWIPLHFL